MHHQNEMLDGHESPSECSRCGDILSSYATIWHEMAYECVCFSCVAVIPDLEQCTYCQFYFPASHDVMTRRGDTLMCPFCDDKESHI